MHDGDDSQLVLLADPDHLGLILADPDASSVGPVGGHSRGSEVVVGSHVVEEEVVVSELVGLGLADEVLVTGSQTVVLARQTERLEHFHHAVLELDALFLVHGGRQVPALDVSGDSGSHGHFLQSRVDLGEHVLADGDAPVVGLLGLAFDLVVLSDEWFQIEAKDVIVFGTSGVGSDRAVIIAESTHHDVE